MSKILRIVFSLVLLFLSLCLIFDKSECDNKEADISTYLDTKFRKQNNLPLFSTKDYKKTVKECGKIIKFTISDKKKSAYLKSIIFHSEIEKEIDEFVLEENVFLEQWNFFEQKVKTQYYLIKKTQETREKLTNEEGFKYKKKYNL